MLDPASGESLDDALGRADERMYQHKSAKRASGAYGRVRFMGVRDSN
jgi:hypothetical protein